MPTVLLVALATLCAVGTAPAAAAATAVADSAYAIVLKDGSRLQGTIVEEDLDHLRILTIGGLDLRVPRDAIASVERLRGRMVEGEFRRADPNYTRLLYAPTGYPLRQGEGYLADHWVFFPSIATGLTDHVSLMGGLSLFPGVALEDQMLYIAPRIGTRLPGGAVSVGTLLFSVETETVGVAFGMASFGPPDASLSVGIGKPYAEPELADVLVLGVGGNKRLSDSAAFVMENWVVIEDEAHVILGPGIRFFGDRLAGDFAILLVPEEPDGVIPWLSLTYNFGGESR